LTGVVTAVDPALLLPYLGNGDDLADAGLAAAATDQRTVADTWARQLEYAPVLAVLDSPEADDEDRALLAQLHPTAHRVAVPDGDLAAAVLAGFDVEAAAAAQHPACALLPQEADAAGVSTYVWRDRRPFHPGRLYAALEDLACAAVRSRGRFWLADRPDTLLAWDAAGGALCVESTGPWLASLPDAAWEMVPPVRRAAAALDWDPELGDRCQHLVFTSPGLDREGLAELLASCLLTDAEYAAGRTAWKQLPSAFDTLLEV
ncbi:GTP-binding protein, partial [Streptomyces roseolilacinus]|uniref:GTP-binding protein n=1 Tax=Streptomyces roseolilacinus TaxID=66904 RepID=UPI00382A121E